MGTSQTKGSPVLIRWQLACASAAVEFGGRHDHGRKVCVSRTLAPSSILFGPAVGFAVTAGAFLQLAGAGGRNL